VDESFSKIVEQALDQAMALYDLDAPRAEVWASDLVAMALEAADREDAEDPVQLLLRRLDDAGGVAGSIAARSVRSLLGDDGGDGASRNVIDGLPGWIYALGTSRCDGAWVFSNRRGESAVFRFVDSAEADHAIAIDLIPGAPESVGEVMVGPAGIVDLADDPDSEVAATPVGPVDLAGRVARAIGSTGRVRQSLMIHGALVVSRLSELAGVTIVIPAMVVDEVPEPPRSDPDDDEYALDLLHRALGMVRESAAGDSSPAGAPEPTGHLSDSLGAAAASLRRAADVDDPIAQWLAASRGPVDLDESDSQVVFAVLAAVTRPQSMASLEPDVQEAVAALEWADWLGVVIGLVREGAGASIEAAHMVDLINRCPEVASTIPRADRPRIEWAFARCTELWEEIGLAEEGKLTDFGAWALPHALVSAWQIDR